MTSDLITKAVEAVSKGKSAYCKFLSANDSGETKAHQLGILISIKAKSMLFTDNIKNLASACASILSFIFFFKAILSVIVL